MPSKLLSICIPTLNRAGYLRDNLEKLIPVARQYDLPIYVSDNASTDETPEVLKEMSRQYQNLFVSRNESTLRSEKNYARALKLAPTKYVWLLSDDDRIVGSEVGKLLELLENNKYDAVIVNGGRITKDGNRVIGRVADRPESTDYDDRNKLMADLGWHMTWISCIIFDRAIIKEEVFARYYETHFIQFAAIFDVLKKETILVRWQAEPIIYNTNYEEPSWFPAAIEIWAKRWYEVFDLLPSCYSQKNIDKCRMDHGVKTRVLSIRYLLAYRILNYFNYQVYKRYCSYFQRVTNVNKRIMLLISLLPIPSVLSRYFRPRIKQVYGMFSWIKYRREKCGRA